MKTNAARILDAFGIPYEMRTYPWSPEHLGAVHVAAALGLQPEVVWKTLVARTDARAVVQACLPGPAELDLKALAAAAGAKRAELVPVREIQALTGYVRGGVSPLPARRPLPLYLDAGLPALPLVSVSAGRRGLQILLSGADLLRATGGSLAEVSR